MTDDPRSEAPAREPALRLERVERVERGEDDEGARTSTERARGPSARSAEALAVPDPGGSERALLTPAGRSGRPAGPARASTESEAAAAPPMRILVVEDNPDMAAAIRQGLRENGYSVDVAHKGFEGEELAASEPYDLVILDVMLPDRDGIDLCRNLRRRGVAALILMLTALSSTEQKISGLDAGADDYLTKPFEFEELLARIRALLRRGQATEATKLEYGGVQLDLIRRRVHRDGHKIKLSAKEFALLEFFLRNTDRVVDRMTIAQKVWDINFEPSSNVIDVCVSALRKKLDREFDHALIHTVVGMGYRFGQPEEEAEGAPG